MVTAEIAHGWQIDVERGPDCVFVRLHPNADGEIEGFALADKIWTVLQQSFTYRLVLELDLIERLQSYLIAQLVLVSKRIRSHDGMVRLCGLSVANQEVLAVCRLDRCLPNFESRGDALMGTQRPLQPR
jgi:anti-anti-sigma regulatory factor